MEMKLASKNPPETKFCHTKDITLLSHTPKKNKIVLVASTYLHTREITDGKPNIILHYNATKGGTDTFGQLCHAYSVARRTNKWPMRIFFGMLDQAAVNSRIMWRLKVTDAQESTTAIIVLKKLVAHLTHLILHQRLTGQFLRKKLQIGIKNILQSDHNPEMDDLETISFDPARRCVLCDRKKCSGRYLSFYSNHPKCIKRGIVYGLVDRAILLSHPSFFYKNIYLCIEMLIVNSYPLDYIFNIINRRIKCLIERCKVNFDNSEFSLNKNRNCRDCDSTYVGQTKRQLQTRIKEHRNNIRMDSSKHSVISQHIIDYGHSFDWENVDIMDVEHNYKKRLISEMLHIKEQSKGLNYMRDTELLSESYISILMRFRHGNIRTFKILLLTNYNLIFSCIKLMFPISL
ncbi:hypothetical protein ALC62_07519 [Cyphomyrmex costatus]|uniref:Uncharacterized protein n=1 Tax=Cyphomyrmex costatus TaxID=456900 RepID=A0A151IHL6_9HYME|nr:hypothetical protein ALC62_07519 [Cyphomyrmex costatus]